MIDPNMVEGMQLLRNAAMAKKPDAEKATREFDAYFLSQFLKSAGSASEEHMLDGGSAGRMYRDQFFDEIARILAEHGGMGVSQQLAAQLGKEASGGEGETGNDSPEEEERT